MSQLDILCNQFNKQYKETIASKGVPKREIKKIPFTSPLLNYMTYGGVPRGAIVEFAGENNGGKTTTALDVVANAQRLFFKEYEDEVDELTSIEKPSKEQQARMHYLEEHEPKKVVYVDCENTLDEEWAKKLDVDTEEMILLRPFKQTAEQIFEMILQMIETDEVGLVVLDSLGVMVSQQAYDKTMEENTYGGISKPLTLFGAKAVPLCSKFDCTLIAINQVRDDMSGFGRVITPGGKGWKHDCSLRLLFKKGDYIDENNNILKRSSTHPAGNLVEIAIAKTKVCTPNRLNGYYTLKYENGVDIINDTVELALLYDIIQKGGSWFSIINTEAGEIMQIDTETGKIMQDVITDDVDCIQDLKFQGKASLIEFLKNDTEIFNLIYKQVMEKLEE